jgi:hypothetical protein
MQRVECGLWSKRTFGALLLMLAPILATYAILLRESRAVPMYDDYQAVVSFIVIFKQLPSVGSKLLFIVAAQHDEYKLIFEHAVLAAQYAFVGHVSFSFMIWTGNLLLLGVAWVLWHNYFSDETDLARRFFLFAPICFLLFQLNYVENLDWAMCGMQTVPVLFFTLASLHFLLGRERWFPLACVCAILGCLSSANAFVMGPIGLLVLVPRRRWAAIAVWTMSFAIALTMYLYRYKRITRLHFDPNISIPHKIIFFLSFAGGALENMHRTPVRNGSVVLGLLIVLIFMHSLRTHFYKTNPFGVYSAVWFLLSAGMVAQVRSGLGMDLSLALRYKIYCDLLLIFCYGYGIHRLEMTDMSKARKRQLYVAALGSTILLSASGDLFGYKFLVRRQTAVETGLNSYAADPQHNVPEVSMDGSVITSGEPSFARKVLTQAIELRLYKLPGDGKR